MQASAQTTSGPRALAMIATPLPVGSGCSDITAAASSRSSSPSQRITPALANSASTVESDAAINAPVCEDAARAPALVRPALTASTGFARATRRATRPNLRGLPNDSRYRATTSVAGSCSQYCNRSLEDRSALSPSDTNALSPIPRRDAPSIAAAPNAPDCDTNPIDPAGTSARANVAVSDTSGDVFTTPMQFGPTSRIPLARHTSSSSASRAAPSAPASANPAVMTTSAETPAAAHSRATPGTAAAGTATIARSTPSETRGVARRDPTNSAFGLTACSSPRKSLARMWRKAAPPKLSGRRDAPTTATDRGRSTRSTAATAATRSRSSKRRRASAPSSVGNVTSIPSGEARTSTGNPDSRNTLIMRRFSGRTVAVNVVTPRALATCARCAISTVASPRPCISSATANATSARSARSISNTACATTRSSAPVVTIRP